jgi:hypothetical protein
MGERDKKLAVPKSRSVIHEAANSVTRVPIQRGPGVRTLPPNGGTEKDDGGADLAANGKRYKQR